MLSIKKCIKRGAATTLLLLAAITIQADNVMKRHADGTCSVNTSTICKARGYRKGTPVEVYFKNGKVLKVVALKNEETVPYFSRVKQFLLPLYNNLKISKAKNYPSAPTSTDVPVLHSAPRQCKRTSRLP